MVFWPILVLTHFVMKTHSNSGVFITFALLRLWVKKEGLNNYFDIREIIDLSVSFKVIFQTIPLPCFDSAVNMQTTPDINFRYFCYRGHWRGPLATARLPADPFLSSPNINEGAHKGCSFDNLVCSFSWINTRDVYVWKVNLFQRFCIIFTCMTYAIRFTDTVPLISLKHILF